MAEYISREDYCEENCGKENREGYKTCTNCGMINIPAADVQPVNRWISIKESKPEDMQQVLAVVDGDTREAFYNAGCFIGSNFYRSINEVKWWQPLPELPKDGDTE